MVWLGLLVLATTGCLGREAGPYVGEKIFRLHISTEKELSFIQALQETTGLQLDFWGHPALGHDLDIRVPVESLEGLKDVLDSEGIKHSVKVDDLQALVDKEKESNEAAAKFNKHGSVATKYARTDEIYALMRGLARDYPDIAELIHIGKSFEKRDLYVLKISTGPGKKSVFINSGFHSREWIASASTVWMMNEMVTRFGKDEAVTSALDMYDWYFLPMANPDGYEYSHDVDRFWRKTRSYNWMCDGADPNRNWDAHFGGTGTSNFPCSDIYHGRYAFSEVETAAQSSFLKKLIPQGLVMYMDIHAFSQLWFVPYGAAPRFYPADYKELKRVADIGAKVISEHAGRKFKVGTPADILYAATGGAFDWAKLQGVKYSYAMELRPTPDELGSDFSVGFIVNAKEIPDSGRETLNGIIAAAHAMEV